MNEEIDEYQVYHQDFTTVSEWEVFIARIEEMLMEWRLSKSQIVKYPNYKKKWIKSSEEFDFQGLTFTLSYHTIEYEFSENKSAIDDKKTLLTELQDGIWEAANNFIDDEDGSPFAVSNWFGLKRYLMLCCNKPLTDGSLIKTVLSSVNIASANVQCAVPLFVKIREEWQQCYLGFFEDNQFKTSFDTIHLKRISHQCSYLKNLVGLFKSKIASPVAIDEILGSAKFSYELKELDAFMWNNSIQTNEFLSIEGIDVEKLIELPFGSTDNPVQSAMLNAIWPTFRENSITDRESWSQLNPLRAPIWTITLKMAEKSEYLLFSIIAKMMSILQDTSFLMDSLGLSRSLGLHNPLHKITEAPITISKLVKAAISQSTNKSVFKGPLGDDMLMPILYYLFPDAVEDSTFGYPTSLEVELKQTNANEQKLCSYVKTGPVGGLVWRLSLVAARLLDEGGLPYLAHLWYEFVQELQYRWENHILVPGIADGTPDARSCLLHQKLQLLNCCITRAKAGGGGAGAGAASNSSEEEFYDCTESEGEEPAPWDRPAGRLRRLGDATLQNGAPLYVPVTQDPAPKTEDELEEDAELMVRLGNDAKASELRARMMSASLLSDMESFKAANPGATLCDFVQWYSPRDWKPDGGGALGERMLLPGNPWAEAWSVARPVPAARQRRLFDEARVAARLLHYLSAPNSQ